MCRFLSTEALRRTLAGALAALLVVGISPASATILQTIELRSGVDANADGRDDNVTFFEGPRDGPFPGPITAAQLAAASAGDYAYLVNPLNPTWNPVLAADPLAKWIGKGFTAENPNAGPGAGADGVTAIYAIDFTIDVLAWDSVYLDFTYLVDDALGDANSMGLFVNFSPVPGSTDLAPPANYISQQAFPTFDISSLVSTGTNTLYIYVNDSGGGGSGINFNAKINVVSEPAALGVLGIGLLALGALRRRRRT